MNVLIASPTNNEIEPLINYLESNHRRKSFGIYSVNTIDVRLMVTGIGTLFTAQALTKALDLFKPDLLIHVGIAGSFRQQYPLGATCQVVTEQFGDLGAEMADGSFQDLMDLALQATDRFPFKNGRLCLTEKCPVLGHLPHVHGLSVHTVTGTSTRADRLLTKYNTDIETMEGMAVYYCALSADVPFLTLRSISNYVGPRNRASWEINKAINNLNGELINYLLKLG